MTSRKPKAATADRSDRFKVLLAELSAASGLAKNNPRLVQACWIGLAQENLQSAILAGSVVEIGELERYSAALKDILPSARTTLRVEFVEPNLAFLDDAQLAQLEGLMAVATGRSPPVAEPEPDERSIGPSEAAGIVCGRFIDHGCEAWAHRPLNADERRVLRTHIEMMARGFSLRSLWDDVSARPSPSAQPLAAEPSPAPPSAQSPPEAGPAPAPTNVTPLRSVHDHAFAPLSRRGDEPWRWG
jgi:hypothetical protein